MAEKKTGKTRATSKRASASDRPEGGGFSGGRHMPSRLIKRRLVERLRQDTAAMNSGNLTAPFRKLGYEDLPLDELQDRLSKLQTPLAEVILKGRV